MSEMDDIIGNLNASVAELEKALATAQSAGLTNESVAGMEAMLAKMREEVDKMHDLAMERGLPEDIKVRPLKLKDRE